MHKRVAIVGGGVAGASVALYLSKTGVEVSLFEKEVTLVSGPPMCHLHAGGNLYREIDDAQCKRLLKESIELLHFYPYAVDFRPTVIATPLSDAGDPLDLLPRLEMLQQEYETLIRQDGNNKVLGEPQEYFHLFYRDELEHLATLQEEKTPKTLQEWMIPVAKNVDLEKLKFPLVMVQEYGLNIFRISASATLLLERQQNVTTHLQTIVKEITQEGERFALSYEKKGQMQTESFDFLINAGGFRSGEIDDMLGIHTHRLVEFKAAYVTKYYKYDALWPEVIFHGKRGTPQGMAQFTPYPDGYFQLHGMTKDITLFDGGLVKSSPLSAQPKLDAKFIQKIDKGWQFSAVQQRTQTAIEYLAQYIPAFKDAKVASKPLYGAQQIPGEDADLRASEVAFVGERYARCETVKASSVITMAKAIAQQLQSLGYIENFNTNKAFEVAQQLSKQDVDYKAQEMAQLREYPSSLAFVNNDVKF